MPATTMHFLLRSEFEAVNRAGLSLNSAVHGFRRLAPVQAYHSAQDMPPCDWLAGAPRPPAITNWHP